MLFPSGVPSTRTEDTILFREAASQLIGNTEPAEKQPRTENTGNKGGSNVYTTNKDTMAPRG